ncbi:MAG: hypothetical protein ACRDA9_12580, partial [Plesiomonas shigelloides]
AHWRTCASVAMKSSVPSSRCAVLLSVLRDTRRMSHGHRLALSRHCANNWLARVSCSHVIDSFPRSRITSHLAPTAASLALFFSSLPRRDNYIYDFTDYYIHDPTIFALFNH